MAAWLKWLKGNKANRVQDSRSRSSKPSIHVRSLLAKEEDNDDFVGENYRRRNSCTSDPNRASRNIDELAFICILAYTTCPTPT